MKGNWFKLIYWAAALAQGVGTYTTVAYAFGAAHGIVAALSIEALFLALDDGVQHRFTRALTRVPAIVSVYLLLAGSGALQLAYALTFDASAAAAARFGAAELRALAALTAASPNIALLILVTLKLLGMVPERATGAARRASSAGRERSERPISISVRNVAVAAAVPVAPVAAATEPIEVIAPTAVAPVARRGRVDRALLAQLVEQHPGATSAQLAQLHGGISAQAVRRVRLELPVAQE